jgi:hypothetical protein
LVFPAPDRNGEVAELFLNPREAVQKAPAPQGFVNERKWIGFALLPTSGRSQPFLHQVPAELKEELLPGVETILAVNLVQWRKRGRAAGGEQPYASGRRNSGGGGNILELCR